MSVDGRVNSHGNVANAGQVGGGSGTGMVVKQSSVGGIPNERVDQKLKNKGLEQHGVSEGNNSSATEPLPNNAYGNGGDQQGVMEKQNNVGPLQPVAETTKYTCEDAMSKLYECFKSSESSNIPCLRTFDFKRFAKVNEIPLNESYIPHSDVVNDGFRRMYALTNTLLSNDVTIWLSRINLYPKEVCRAIDSLRDCQDEKDKPYKLYSELGNVVLDKLLKVVKDDFYSNNKIALDNYIFQYRDIFKTILSLPLVNFAEGMDLCTRMLESALIGDDGIFRLSEPKLTDEEREGEDHQKLVNDFKALGMFFAFKNNELGEKLLPAAQFATSIGMKMPLFMAEITTEDKEFRPSGFSDDIVGVAVRDTAISKKDFKGFPRVNHVFYHEITHHARSAVGAIHADKSIARQNLESEVPVLKDNTSLINAIKSQIRNYALTNSEEYIAEFSALVLCCLEDNKNPFNYIDDTRLWRLYYEFGGPDYAPITQQKGFLPDGYAKDCDILSDKKCDWCSGYPSKFGIDVDRLPNNTVWVRDERSPGGSRLISVTSKTVLPPPPLGYCYTTETGFLWLKIDKNTLPSYYIPLFCSLTNGPLTSLRAGQFQLQYHFELLPNENVDMSKHIDSAKPSIGK